ncbi:MAG TPA: hypothetical protein VGE21_06270 [Flavobacteriales bacterium]
MNTSFLHRPLALAAAIGTLAACSTDLDINAPYRDITVVYALFDKGENDAVHYVKINKAFLGEGDAFLYAQIPDSTTFTDEQLGIHPDDPAAQRSYVEELGADGQVTDTFHLRSVVLDERDPGVFAGPEHKMYYFTAQLDSTRRYRVHVEAKGHVVESVSPVTGVAIPSSVLLSSTSLGLATPTGYSTPEIKWRSAVNGKRHEFGYRFNYREVRNTGDTVARSIERRVGTAISISQNGGEDLSVFLNGEDFYRSIASAIPNDPAVVRRLFDAADPDVADGVDLMWAVAGPDLHIYMQLANPISGLVEDRPEYSNVTGEDAYGLVSSRRFRERKKKTITDNSRAELLNGQYTSGLNFFIP